VPDRPAERHRVPGAAVAVGAGEQVFEAATGVINRNTGVATTSDSLFQIGSVTKVWTASLVMQLVDEGLVGLDEPVRTHLPSFGVRDAAASGAVTVRQLLAHTTTCSTGRPSPTCRRLWSWPRNCARFRSR
jgi:CubicO group peptidase (beta-lactamase class C family)